MLFSSSAVSPNHKIGSNDLIIPTLLVLAHAERAGLPAMTTQKLRPLVKNMLVLSEADNAPLKNRSDAKIDQSFRNLESHKMLIKAGYVSYSTPTDASRPSGSGISLTNKGKAYLASQCLNLIKLPETTGDISATTDHPKSTESGLTVTALLMVAKLYAENDNKPVSMGDLRLAMKHSVSLSHEDMAPLKGRTDTKFDQTIRNFRSHGTLEKLGWVESSPKGMVPTQAGLARLLEEFVDVFPAPDFANSAQAKAPAAQPTTRRSSPRA